MKYNVRNALLKSIVKQVNLLSIWVSMYQYVFFFKCFIITYYLFVISMPNNNFNTTVIRLFFYNFYNHLYFLFITYTAYKIRQSQIYIFLVLLSCRYSIYIKIYSVEFNCIFKMYLFIYCYGTSSAYRNFFVKMCF